MKTIEIKNINSKDYQIKIGQQITTHQLNKYHQLELPQNDLNRKYFTPTKLEIGQTITLDTISKQSGRKIERKTITLPKEAQAKVDQLNEKIKELQAEKSKIISQFSPKPKTKIQSMLEVLAKSFNVSVDKIKEIIK